MIYNWFEFLSFCLFLFLSIGDRASSSQLLGIGILTTLYLIDCWVWVVGVKEGRGGKMLSIGIFTKSW
jgi:hypothetical protein